MRSGAPVAATPGSVTSSTRVTPSACEVGADLVAGAVAELQPRRGVREDRLVAHAREPAAPPPPPPPTRRLRRPAVRRPVVPPPSPISALENRLERRKRAARGMDRGSAPASRFPRVSLVSDLVEALRAAGVADVDASLLRRSLYSSDASLYRVEPQVVVVPQHVDEVLATAEVCRTLGVPLTMRGAGTSIAGNAVGPGVVVDVSPAPAPDRRDRPGGRDGGRAARRRAGVAAARRGAARPALRPRPVDPQPGHARRHDRQQRLRLQGSGLRPHQRQRPRAGRRDRRGGAAAARVDGRRRRRRLAGAWTGCARWPTPTSP